MKIKLEDLKALRLYGGENEGSTLSLKVGKTNGGGQLPPPRVESSNG